MAKPSIAFIRTEVAYWALLYPGFLLCERGHPTQGPLWTAGCVWLSTVRPIANVIAPGLLGYCLYHWAQD